MMDRVDVDNIVEGSRPRTSTLKGAEYSYEFLTSKLQSLFRKWNSNLENAKTCLVSDGALVLSQIKDSIEHDHDDVLQTLCRIRKIKPDEMNFQDEYQLNEQFQFSVLRDISSKISKLDEVKSVKSASRVSKHSSHRSLTSVESAKIKVANAKLKLKYLDLETKAKYELEIIQSKREVEESEAILSALGHESPVKGDKSQDKSSKSLLNVEAESFLPSMKQESCIFYSVCSDNKVSDNNTPPVLQSVNNSSCQTSQFFVKPVCSNLPLSASNVITASPNDNSVTLHDTPLTSSNTNVSVQPTYGTNPILNVSHSIVNYPNDNIVPCINSNNSNNTTSLSNASKNNHAQSYSYTDPHVGTLSDGSPLPNNYIPFHFSRLPLPEPGDFSGEALEYPAWKTAFDSLMSQSDIPPAHRLYYLKKYLKGVALKCVQRFFLFSDPSAYSEAISLWVVLSIWYSGHAGDRGSIPDMSHFIMILK